MRRIAVFFAAFLAAANLSAATADNGSCDITTAPAATLLLPYFEVDIEAPASSALNTVFTVVNTSKYPQVVRATMWTDLGFPAAWFNMFLTGYDAQTVSLYEVLARGRFPMTTAHGSTGALSSPNNANPNILSQRLCHPFGGVVPEPVLRRLQKAFTTGERDEPECRVGLRHRNAIGYITLDVVNSCALESPLSPHYWSDVLLYDNVLIGDFIRLNPDDSAGNYAGATPLVHIRAVPEGGSAGSSPTVPLPYTFYDRYTPSGAKKSDRRQPLPSTFAARFIEGGPTDFRTAFTLWREGVVATETSECAYAKNAAVPVRQASIVRFDEHENSTALSSAVSTPVALHVSTSSAFFPPLGASGDRGGWFWISLDHGAAASRPSQNWISVQMSAEGRYAVDVDATWLASGCVAPPAAP
ncbi:MAG TPA: hypothetical protein VFL80_06250 [Thermoanaerobaculia bacterium]|nr:hypothetical protein [Thermoanaerobaculia bacterium]